MLERLKGLASGLAAAVTATRTNETDAAGIRFGPGTAYPAELVTGSAYRLRLYGHDESEPYAGTVTARDYRAAVRVLSARAKVRPIPVSFDGPAVRFVPSGVDKGFAWFDAMNAEGGSVGILRVERIDGRPIRGKGRE